MGLKDGYTGYEVGVVPVEPEDMFCPLEVPNLDPVEGELTCLDVPSHFVTNDGKKIPLDLPAIIQLYVAERGKKDPYYKGIFFHEDIERLDAWEASCNKDDSLLDSRWDKAYQRW